MMKMYAIPNCDTVKKARKWLDEQGIACQFHDYRKDGVDEMRLRAFVEEFGWEQVLNMRGMTWRRMAEDERAAIHDAESAIQLMLQKPSIIKRPIVEHDGGALLGFDAAQWQATLG